MIPSIGSSGILQVLKHKGFRYLWSAQVLSQIATNTLIFVLALNIYRATGSNTAVSALFLVYAIPAVLFGMIAGTIVDKLDRRKVLFTCDIARSILILIFMMAPNNIAVIYYLTFFLALITQFYVPSEAPAIPYLVADTEIVSANSLFSLTYFSSLAIGSVCSGPLIKYFGPSVAFGILATLFLLAALCVTQIPNHPGLSGRSVRHIFAGPFLLILERLYRNLVEGIQYLSESTVLKDALTLLLGTQIMLAVLATLAPGFADRVLEIDINDSSIIVMGPAVLGILLGSLWVGNKGYKYAAERLIRIGIMSAGIILLSVAFFVRLSRVPLFEQFVHHSTVITITTILFFALGVANSLLDVPANSILQKEGEGDKRGRVYGLLTTAVGGIGILPVISGGILADTIGVGKVVFILACIIILYGLHRIRYSTITK